MDPLSEVLSLTRVRGAVAATLDAGDRWGVDVDDVPWATFHAMIHGVAWLAMDGHPRRRLLPGDLLVLPRGQRHQLLSDPGTATEPFVRLAARQGLTAGGRLTIGHGEPHTRILCGSFHQDAALNAQLLTLLPPVIHLHADPNRPTDHVLHLLAYEISGARSGTDTIRDRLLDVLLVHIVRAWLTTTETESLPPSWLTALRDPLISEALAALHSDIARNWTLTDLATRLTVSRATLARRFSALVGQTPFEYLTNWRMEVAARRLTFTDEPVGPISRAVGYTSEYAFNRAFTRVRGMPPGRFRALAARAERNDAAAGRSIP
ncbi:AraC family transcriptional regulator [Amycolatopsis cynarae]|uniref:AraC family transcriptional regulator n=1 Tax=Amycolatopsis cynarae TaxID=2995223 RepID=A0ABY7B8Z3_9PSEU|nr:AraC family transcriptional regulator [Amycolatopsis sp. HUAS 11-8]WAL68816.1 AraC family transcriptional regulator [Amycolatopsis sp. HUAS 11-8]